MAKKLRPFKPYKSYFFRDVDPVIDTLRSVREGTKTSLSKLSRDSGVAAATMGNWWNGKTRQPKFSTIMAATIAMGGEEALIAHIRGKRRLRRVA